MNNLLPEEHNLRLLVNGIQRVSFICTNEALQELILGWLYNEGIISAVSDVAKLDIVDLSAEAILSGQNAEESEWVLTRSSGLGGYGLSLSGKLQSVSSEAKYSMKWIEDCASEMSSCSAKYQKTGGMHCSAVFDQTGLRYLYEDIGRHNTFDKIAGASLINGEALDNCLLITTGRISADMVKKAARMGIAVIASYTVPTANAVTLAEKLGLALIGYLHRDCRICCGNHRIV